MLSTSVEDLTAVAARTILPLVNPASTFYFKVFSIPQFPWTAFVFLVILVLVKVHSTLVSNNLAFHP